METVYVYMDNVVGRIMSRAPENATFCGTLGAAYYRAEKMKASEAMLTASSRDASRGTS